MSDAGMALTVAFTTALATLTLILLDVASSRGGFVLFECASKMTGGAKPRGRCPWGGAGDRSPWSLAPRGHAGSRSGARRE
ncbi:hypothetical protein PR202_gb04111 [Eleusine coracana subsp. coracana]|uniref:Secreted protein n=1 Tax=Eleusine coracana subsp. coracana TaxID=191504 RepID=A0AAV5E324_ELECO|nr:hypothetical protein PR202_gb04111 [Eleusine coracana subsp. coracana]